MNKSNETTNGLKCEIIRDLLPLYHDGVVSEVTAKEIERHLSDCEPCTAEYESLRSGLPYEEKSDRSTGKRFAGMLKRLKKKRAIVTTLISLASVAAVAGAFYVLTEVPLKRIPADDITVYNAYEFNFDDVSPNDGDMKGHGYFVEFSVDPKAFQGPGSAHIERNKDGKVEIVFTVPLITWNRTKDKKENEYVEIYTYAAKDSDKELLFNGKSIWNAEDGNNGEVPGFVRGYYEFLYDDSSYHGLSNGFIYYDEGDETVMGEKYVCVIDDTTRAWNADGELIFDGSREEWDKMFNEKFGK